MEFEIKFLSFFVIETEDKDQPSAKHYQTIMNIWGSVILYTIGILILLILLAVLIIGIIIVFKWRTDLHQKQHAILRNFPFLARIRYISESISPQLKQYFFDSDVDGKPYSQADYTISP